MIIGAVQTLTPIVYVADLRTASSFYAQLGFAEVLHGNDENWSWVYVRCGELSLLLAAGGDHVAGQLGPVQFYAQSEDVEQVQESLASAGFTSEHMGSPRHAPGGEIRFSDPDGHVVIVAQTTGAPPVETTSDPDRRSTILRRAADAAQKQGSTRGRECRVGERGGEPCRRAAEVKLADTTGDTVWSCLLHTEELLYAVNGLFIADTDREGLSAYLARRGAPLPPAP